MTLFSHFVLSHTSDNTTSRNIGGMDGPLRKTSKNKKFFHGTFFSLFVFSHASDNYFSKYWGDKFFGGNVPPSPL